MSRSLLQLRHLRYFVDVVDAGSFCRAATIIRVAQPALSQQLAAVEAELGVRLLHRSSRGVRPTPEGEVFYREAASILQHVDGLRGIVQSFSPQCEGVVRLGMPECLAACCASELIELCRKSLPNVEIRLITGDYLRLKALRSSRSVDLAIVWEDNPIRGVDRQPLLDQKLVLLTRPGTSLHGISSISLERVASVPLVLPARPNTLRSILDRAFQAAGVTSNCLAEVDTLFSALSLIRAGIADAIVPEGFMCNATVNKDLAATAIYPPIEVTLCLLSSCDSLRAPAAQSIASLLIAHLPGTCFGKISCA